jgi:hypothetical protein
MRKSRVEDTVLVTFAEMALILVYMCVLLIKACVRSKDVCTTFGFGDKPDGLYLFFIFFGASFCKDLSPGPLVA